MQRNKESRRITLTHCDKSGRLLFVARKLLRYSLLVSCSMKSYCFFVFDMFTENSLYTRVFYYYFGKCHHILDLIILFLEHRKVFVF